MQRNRRNLKLKAIEIYNQKKKEEEERKKKLDLIKKKMEEEKKKKEEERRKKIEEMKKEKERLMLIETEKQLKKEQEERLQKMQEELLEKKRIEKEKKELEIKEQELLLERERLALIEKEKEAEKEKKRLNVFSYNESPSYLYIDYSDEYIEQAKLMGYKTFLVDKENGLTYAQQREFLKRTDLVPKNENTRYNIIISCWKVLTKSNLNSLSFDSTNYAKKKFAKKMESTIKWGNRAYLKNRLNEEEKKNYTIFREGVEDFLKGLHENNYNIFIISNSNYSFVKDIFEYYDLKQYITAIFTPSVCGIPSGSIHHGLDSFNDKRKINKERVFTCIEKFVGRMY